MVLKFLSQIWSVASFEGTQGYYAVHQNISVVLISMELSTRAPRLDTIHTQQDVSPRKMNSDSADLATNIAAAILNMVNRQA